MSIARILSATERPGIAARLAQYFDPGAAAALVAAWDTRILAVDPGSPQRGAELVTALVGAGAVAHAAPGIVATVASSMQLAAAALAAPMFASELAALTGALLASTEPRPALRLRERRLNLHDQAQVMGIVNVTPDSFYERANGVAEAVVQAHAIASAGATIVDVGGQSYANGNPRVAAAEESRRVVPAVEAIVAAQLDLAISVDTCRATVADAVLAAGAHLINDCSGAADPLLAQTVAKYDAALVVMHLKGELNVRAPRDYVYADALAEIVEFLYLRTELARAAGVAAESIAIDPGLEFGKEPATDFEILDRFSELTALGYPIVFAASRKSFIGRLFERPARELLVPSLAAAGLGIAAGARLLRVHDVAQTVQLARMYAAVYPHRRQAQAFASNSMRRNAV